MVNNIVFFVVAPFNNRDFKRFGIDVLRNNGFEVLVYDFSPVVYPKFYEAWAPDMAEYEKHFCFFNKSDAVKAIYELGSDTFVIYMGSYSGKLTFWIFKSLSTRRIPYAVSITNVIPGDKPEGAGINKRVLNKFLNKISRLSYRQILNVPYRTDVSQYLGIRAPDLLLAGGVESRKEYRGGWHFGKRPEILWMHTLDYDIYLEMRCQNSVKNSNAVFLDPGVLNERGDYLSTADDPFEIDRVVDKEEYRSSLRNLFNKVEKETGCIVNIAAHPGYVGCSHPDEFGKRLTIVGETAQMIRQSKFVITHGSTAVSFAVIFGKPIIFITTDKLLLSTERPSDIEAMPSWFEKNVINIDHPFDINWDKELLIDKDLYSNYKNFFIKKKGSEEINSWQILANRLKRM